MAMIKTLIVDDHEVVRDGLSSMMERQEDFSVVGQAKNGLEAVEKSAALRPDVVLMELRMPEMDGVEDVEVEMVYDPPWSQEMITEEGKAQLGLD